MRLKPRALRGGVFVVNNEHIVGLMKDGGILASSEIGDCGHLAQIFARIDAEGRKTARVAHIGGGLAWLPKMLLGFKYAQIIYERENSVADLIESFELPFTVVRGDWRDTLAGKYDIIVCDLYEHVTREELTPFLRPKGTLYL